jgi:hypothetical protein
MSRAGDTYSEAVRNAVDAGRKIDAIKIYREENGVGLREAKDAIDQLARERGSTSKTDNSDMREPGSGGASLIKLIVSVAVIIVLYKVFVAN